MHVTVAVVFEVRPPFKMAVVITPSHAFGTKDAALVQAADLGWTMAVCLFANGPATIVP